MTQLRIISSLLLSSLSASIALVRKVQPQLTPGLKHQYVVGATGFHIIAITDCSPHQKWMVHLFFSSARQVGQDDPISWVRANCPDSKNETRKEEAQLRTLYPKAELIDVQVKGPMPDKSWIKPAAMQAFMDAHPSMPNSTVVALTDPDMIFLTKFRTHDLGKRALPSGATSSISKEYSTEGPFVEGLVGAAQHYLCCEGIGAPYVLTSGAWRLLTVKWEEPRLASGGKDMGWGSEQNAFSTAARSAGIKFNIFDHFMVSVPHIHAPGEGIQWIKNTFLDHGLADTCKTGLIGEASLLDVDVEANPMPTFLHVVRPWGISRLGWMYSKYQIPPGWSHNGDTEGILECSMPLLAEPPKNLIHLAADDSEKLNAWGLCTITHGLNNMLRKFKASKCEAGFNSAPALKYVSGWVNELLPGGTDAVPESSQKWVKKCVEHCDCGL